MKNKIERSKGVKRKRSLSRRIRTSVLLLSATGVASVLYLVYSMKNIMQSYTTMMKSDYQYTEYMLALEEDLFSHQNMVMEHLITSSSETKSALEEKTSTIKSDMSQMLFDFGKDMNGSKYEIRYRSLYGNILGYLFNTDTFFELSHKGDIDSAKKYMDETLIDYIAIVNDDFRSFNNMVRADMKEARNKLELETRRASMSALGLLAVIVLFSAICQIICVRISTEMIHADAVTGIANYYKFLEFGDRKKRKKTLSDYSVVKTNIKGFQYINQQLGVSYGDVVLTEYGSYIKKLCQKNEIVARINSDSFIALIRKERVATLLDYIKNVTISVHMKSGTKKINIDSRFGIYDISDKDYINEAVSYADIALKTAKSASMSDCVWYSEDMSENDIAAKETINKFREAIKNREFVVYYQPKVDMKTNKLCGCEALVRWIKDGKLIPPFKFIPVLEEEGSITELDFYVFEQVCKDISEWKNLGIEPVRVSSNFSKLHLRSNGFAENVLDIISEYNVESKYIEIELTESSGYDDFEAITRFVNEMKKHKIYTAIDDFGTGYSSLSILKDLDIDVVKLDKSFLNGAEDDAHKKMIENVVRMIIDLNRKVICEGVETVQQANFLKSVDCYMAQGYLYDKPLPHDDFENRLKNPVYNVS